ncbi:MAG: permease-like cell division protein FtsX [Clostridia bacterium]|nr:permease-like cell division protein FtsX [Clostridia bacterium]
MRKYSLSYFLSQSFKGLWRNGVMSAASILVLMALLIVMGSFSLLVYNIDVNLENIGVLNEIVVFCDENCTDEEIADIGRQIRLLDNVNEDMVKHNTKQQILDEERAKYAGTEVENVFKEMVDRGVNPYRDEFIVTYNDNSEVTTLEYQLGQIQGIDKINSRADLAEKVEGIKNSVTFIFIFFLVVLFVVSLFVIINTIKLAVYARKQEIAIMRYVGATKWFITLPFVFEGMLIGLIASGVAYLVEWYMYTYIGKMLMQNSSILTIVPFSQVDGFVILGFLAVGLFSGIVGSAISLRKYLKA